MQPQSIALSLMLITFVLAYIYMYTVKTKWRVALLILMSIIDLAALWILIQAYKATILT